MSKATMDLVEKELHGEATPEEIAILEADKVEWKRQLVAIKVKIQNDMVANKAESLRKGHMNHKALTAFTEWKARAVHVLGLVDQRSGRLKQEIKSENRASNSTNYWDDQLDVLEDILEEIRGLRADLASRSSPLSASKEQ